MKTLIVIIILFCSCKTEKELQIQTGTCTIIHTPSKSIFNRKSINEHLQFQEQTAWRTIPLDTAFSSFRVKSVKRRVQ